MRAREVGVPSSRVPHALLRPRSTRFRAVDESRRFCHWFTCVTPSYLACPATASGCAVVPVRCQGCSRPPWQLPWQTALSFSQPLRRPGVGLVTHAETWRLVAHRGSRPRPEGQSGPVAQDGERTVRRHGSMPTPPTIVASARTARCDHGVPRRASTHRPQTIFRLPLDR
jgi:hypothetical protein